MRRKRREKKSREQDGDIVNAFTWGTGEGGQLGYGDESTPVAQDVPRPAFPIGASKDRHVLRAAAGGRHSLFLLRSGAVLACGIWDDGQLGCRDRPVVRTPDGEEMDPTPKSLVPRGSMPSPVPVRLPPKIVVKELAAGFGSSFLLTDFGEVWSWGLGKYGCLGLGDTTNRWYPERIPMFAESRDETVTQISVGKWHAACLTQKGRVYAWGRNGWGQIGTGRMSYGETSPVKIRWPSCVKCPLLVTAGAEHCAATVMLNPPNLRLERVVYAWGNPSNGRLGSNRESGHATPMEVEDLTEALIKWARKITALAAGGTHTLALLDSGEVAAWGGGEYGQLGDGHMWDRPESVMTRGLQGVRSVSAGARHSVALTADVKGTYIWGWGFNRWGELGCGDCTMRLQPHRVNALDGCTVEGVVAGERHTIAWTAGRARKVMDLKEYRGFIDAYRSGGLLVYETLKRTMREKALQADWLDTPHAYFPGQPGMTDSDCRPGVREPRMEWCMDAAPPGKRVFENLRGGHEVVHFCRPCGRERVCLACARNCHANHHTEPLFRSRISAEPCDCSTAPRMCVCKWSRMRDHFRSISSRSSQQQGQCVDVGEDGSVHPSQLRELLQIVRGGAAFVTSDDVSDGIAQLTQGGELDRIEFVPFERWYEEYFREESDAGLDDVE